MLDDRLMKIPLRETVQRENVQRAGGEEVFQQPVFAGAMPAVTSLQRGGEAVREVADTGGVKLGAVAQPLRAALTGRKTSPGIFDVLELLGRDESLGRIADRMAAHANPH